MCAEKRLRQLREFYSLMRNEKNYFVCILILAKKKEFNGFYFLTMKFLLEWFFSFVSLFKKRPDNSIKSSLCYLIFGWNY
jgi:hypothetical protein